MAYNREWDQGKESWDHNGGWDDDHPRGNVRGREEDYYGSDNKRRKFNEGVRSRFPTTP
jgi:RNA-binding protein 5/10